MDERQAFLAFCKIVAGLEKDKDTFLKAANLERHERKKPRFDSDDLLADVVILGMFTMMTLMMYFRCR